MKKFKNIKETQQKLGYSYKSVYSQVRNKRPPRLLIFRFFSNPPDLIRTPRLLIIRKFTFLQAPRLIFSLLVLFTPDFNGKIAYCCIYFSCMLYDNLFLFFTSLYNHLKPFLKSQPPFISTSHVLNFQIFSDPPVY